MRVITILHQQFGFTRNEILTILFLGGTLVAGTLIRVMSPERGTTNIPRFDYLQSDSEFVSRARLPITDVKVHRDPRLTDGPTAKSRPKEKSVNLNTASRTALLDLPGVGPAYADRILAYRASRGLFRTIDELALVKGIGTKRLEKMRPFLTLR